MQVISPWVRASVERMIAALQEELAQIEAQVAALVDSDEALAQKAELLQTMVGVGRSRARRLLYQAAVVAVSHDTRWRAVSEGLLAKGKAKQVSWYLKLRKFLKRSRCTMPVGVYPSHATLSFNFLFTRPSCIL